MVGFEHVNKNLAVAELSSYIGCMTGTELRAAIRALGLKQNQFAKMIERREGTVSDWCNDKWPVPREVELLLDNMQDLRGKTLETVSVP
jgi:DNA-binding transcriptional regulator YiaG